MSHATTGQLASDSAGGGVVGLPLDDGADSAVDDGSDSALDDSAFEAPDLDVDDGLADFTTQERPASSRELLPPPIVPPPPTAALSPRLMYFRAWEAAWPKAVCQAVMDEFPESAFVEATVQTRAGDTLVDATTRKTKHHFIDPMHWTGALISHYAHLANLVWRFDLTGLGTMSILRYDEVGSHFTWHADVLAYDQSAYPGVSDVVDGRPLERKLSVTVNLSHPDDYDGGELEFVNASGMLIQPRELRTQGSTVIFPSTLGHRVTPLTRGVRYALVGWMVGPPLR